MKISLLILLIVAATAAVVPTVASYNESAAYISVAVAGTTVYSGIRSYVQ